VIDIHDRKVAEDRLDLAVNSGHVGLWYCDLPFDTLVWNAQVKEHFGLSADAVVTIDTFFERMHPEDREPTRRAIDTAIANRATYDTHYRTVAPDGRVRWIRALGRAHYDGDRPVHFDGITIDVTELVSLRERAEAANRAKDEFLAMLGHELRNPLAPILTAVQLLALRGGSAIARERAVIERQVSHLVGLVDDLLDVSRITRGQVELRRQPVELADAVAQGVELASAIVDQQRHRLHVEVPRGLVVHGDPGRLAQVVGNLVTNAAKYTERDGDISIVGGSEGGDAVLLVRDTGVGITASMLPRVFDPFVQEAQTLARSRGGLGLGLAIVRTLVELHGGSVTAASDGDGAGSVFSVRLPLAAQPSAAPEDDGAAPAAPLLGRGGGRVLVVDDNEDAASLLGVLLEELGYQVQVVHDGPSALATVDEFRPDVALIDIGLPVMDGLEVARRLRQNTAAAATRLVALTGYGQERDRHASRAAGFSVHLVKPVDAAALRAVLESS
jgi:PAS domain S-box-containing protein